MRILTMVAAIKVPPILGNPPKAMPEPGPSPCVCHWFKLCCLAIWRAERLGLLAFGWDYGIT